MHAVRHNTPVADQCVVNTSAGQAARTTLNLQRAGLRVSLALSGRSGCCATSHVHSIHSVRVLPRTEHVVALASAVGPIPAHHKTRRPTHEHRGGNMHVCHQLSRTFRARSREWLPCVAAADACMSPPRNRRTPTAGTVGRHHSTLVVLCTVAAALRQSHPSVWARACSHNSGTRRRVQ